MFKRASLGNQPTGTYTHAVRRVYDDYGNLVMVHAAELDGTPGETYWQALQADPFGGIAKAYVGDANTAGERLEEVRLVNLATGRLQEAETGVELSSGGAAGIVDMSFAWDLAGNLTSRSEANLGLAEHFCYDGLSRLTGSRVSTSISCGSGATDATWMGYDSTGSLTEKGEYSAYRYVAGKHHVDEMDWTDPVTQATSTIGFSYDANGNILSKGGASYTWSSYNKPTEMTTGTGVTTQFRYGADRARYKQVVTGGSPVDGTTIYVGALYERHTPGDGTTQHRLRVFAGSRMVAQVKLSSTTGTTTKTEFFHYDHLGSIVAVTDSEHALLTDGGRLSYDAWGKRRDPLTWASPAEGTFLANQAATRGYTGHEHLPHAGLIHMNGRIYDPEIGRFLSADPFVQFPESTQGFNRYTYVNNNPLSYNDPSGFFLSALIGIALKEFGVQSVLMRGFVSGFLASGGDLKAGLQGMVSAGVANHIGGIEGLNTFETAILHGVTQGAISEASGGRFGDGALGAFFGHVTGGIAPDSPVGGTIVTAIVGGTVAKIGGGKFANGAVSAAMTHVYNTVAHKKEVRVLTHSDDASIPAGGYASGEEAAKAQMEAYDTEYSQTGRNEELTGAVVESSLEIHGADGGVRVVKRYYYTEMVKVSSTFDVSLSIQVSGSFSAPNLGVHGLTHTHPADASGYRQEAFSGGRGRKDSDVYNMKSGYMYYLRTPKGQLLEGMQGSKRHGWRGRYVSFPIWATGRK